ncbi:hypothetical protein FXO37_04980 [Capsicum annuum]|nr:hypothetical protein FXO37_04980 [Capsicum annuum]
MDEIWINYCGMPICFDLQEFAIVKGLRCHHPEEPPPRKRSKARKYKENIDGLFDIDLRGYKVSDLLTDLKDKIIPEKYREKLCLVWFANSVILARDVNKIIKDDLLARVEDFDKFNNYLWGNDNFYLTVQYLLTKLSPRTTKLCAVPCTFMVVHPWIVPTEEESAMTSYITLGPVDTITDPMVELIKKELAGATAIKRAVRQGPPQPYTGPSHPYIRPSHLSSLSCYRCECEE